jgi:hypothetical protein
MFVRTESKSYVNLDNGHSLTVRESRAGGEWRVVSVAPDKQQILYALQGGYASQEDAQNALDEMMDAVETVLQLQPPQREEEKAEGEE